MTTYAQEVFDQALRLEEGQSLMLECYSRGQMNSLRVLLARERKKFLEKTGGTDSDVLISTRTSGERGYIIVTKGGELSRPVIIDRDGAVIRKAELPRLKPQDTHEEERIASLMREDGWSEEAIKEHLGKEN